MGYQKRKLHDFPGCWYTVRRRGLLYHPTYPLIKDDQTDEAGAVCKYAGYLILDTAQLTGGDSRALDRWKAVPLLCIADRPERTAQTKSLLLEAIDRMYVPRTSKRRRYVPGTTAAARHPTEAQ